MSSKIENQYGYIKIDNEVIAKIAGLAAMECYGVVGMAAKNAKDGFAQLLKRESLTKGILLHVNENNIVIDLHIIVEYGTNISAIGDALVGSVKYRVEEYTGVTVSNVNIFVEGVRVDTV